METANAWMRYANKIKPDAGRALMAEIGRWSDATFGSHRDPERTLKHLRREVDEALANCDGDPDPFEYADIFMLAVDAARRYGLDYSDLLEYVDMKHRINLSRTWGEPDLDGVVEHVREAHNGDAG